VRADDFSHIVLTRHHHARGVEVSDFASPEFHDADAVVDVAVFFEAGVAGVGAEGDDGF